MPLVCIVQANLSVWHGGDAQQGSFLIRVGLRTFIPCRRPTPLQKSYENENSAQRVSFWDGYPADIRGSFARIFRPKTSVRALKILENKHLGADIHDPKARTSTTLRDFRKLRSEKLWAEFSFPNIRGRKSQRAPNPPEFAQPRLSRVQARSSLARGYKFGCVCSYDSSRAVQIQVGLELAENPPEKIPPKLKSSSEQVFLNNFRWVPDSCHRKKAKVPANFSKKPV